MSELGERVQHTLNESRMLILGAQVLVGFAFEASFQKGFRELPRAFQIVDLVALGALVVVLALLIAPAAYHRIVTGGRDDPRVERVGTVILSAVPLPLGGALGADLAVLGARVGGAGVGWGAGAVTAVMALALFYGPRVLPGRGRGADRPARPEKTELKDRVTHVLTEARVVLPGAQALLGFGLLVALTERFGELPASSRAVHLAGVGCIALAIVLLMMPAAYHRIVLGGAITPELERVASGLVLAGMAPLALAIAADLFVVVRTVTDSTAVGVISGALAAALFFVLWYAIPVWLRARSRTP